MSVRIFGLKLSLFIGFNFLLNGCNNDTMNGVFPKADPAIAAASGGCSGASILPNRFIVEWNDGHTSIEFGENADLFKQKFIRPKLAKIKHVEFDQKIKIQNELNVEATPPNNPTWGQDKTLASAAWSAGIKGQGVLVGVVDAAVDYTHPQIKPRLATNLYELNGRPGIDDDNNGFIDDLYGWDFEQNLPDPHDLIYPLPTGNSHGTHVSGIIAGDHTQGTMQGIAPQAQIVPANFMDESGSGSLGGAIQAVQYVASRGVKVINASWGGPVCSQSLSNVISGLAARNILFVAASGNDGHDLDSYSDYPANFNFDNQVTVAASNVSEFLTSWSNTSFSIVHLGAPGEQIYSTVPGGYAYMSGTSMATPFVAGSAALLWSLKPTATYAQIKQALLAGTEYKGFRVKTQGRLNISNSINALKQLVP